VVVEAEVNETNKTTLRSEWSSALKKKKKGDKKLRKTKKGLDTADVVRDASLTEPLAGFHPPPPQTVREVLPHTAYRLSVPLERSKPMPHIPGL
jgi:hypothetical protein